MPPPSTVQLGAAIRQLREKRGLSIEALAHSANLHWTYVSEIERGRRNPSWTVVCALADGLGVDLAELAAVASTFPE